MSEMVCEQCGSEWLVRAVDIGAFEGRVLARVIDTCKACGLRVTRTRERITADCYGPAAAQRRQLKVADLAMFLESMVSPWRRWKEAARGV